VTIPVRSSVIEFLPSLLVQPRTEVAWHFSYDWPIIWAPQAGVNSKVKRKVCTMDASLTNEQLMLREVYRS
jgi:hypothetical protein